MLEKIISGGQTGVDRAALDAAIDSNFACGGFCPKGRIAEDGMIDAKYPLQELPSQNYAKRTLENVLCSDSTLIIYSSELKGGTALTLRLCQQHKKLFLLLDAKDNSVSNITNNTFHFIQQNEISTLNVAGPRKSQWHDGYQYTYRVIEELIKISKIRS